MVCSHQLCVAWTKPEGRKGEKRRTHTTLPGARMSLAATIVQPVVDGKITVQSRWLIVEPHNRTACKRNGDDLTAHRETLNNGQHYVKLCRRSSLGVLWGGG